LIAQSNDNYLNRQVLSTNGDTHLGGEDFDQRVIEYFIKLYKKKSGKDIRKDHRAVQKLRREVEKAKRALSNQHQVRALSLRTPFYQVTYSEPPGPRRGRVDVRRRGLL